MLWIWKRWIVFTNILMLPSGRLIFSVCGRWFPPDRCYSPNPHPIRLFQKNQTDESGGLCCFFNWSDKSSRRNNQRSNDAWKYGPYLDRQKENLFRKSVFNSYEFGRTFPRVVLIQWVLLKFYHMLSFYLVRPNGQHFISKHCSFFKIQILSKT